MESQDLTREIMREDPLVSRWLEMVSRLEERDRLLQASSTPLLLNLAGCKHIEMPGLPPLTWVWRELSVDINGGGLIVEGSLTAPRGFALNYERIDSSKLGSRLAEALGSSDSSGFYFNPLAWSPRAPILLPNNSPGLSVCVETEWGFMAFPRGLAPIGYTSASRCVRVDGSTRVLDFSTGGFKTTMKGVVYNVGGSIIVSGDGFIAGITGSTLRMYAENGVLEFSHRYYKPRVKILYPFIYEEVESLESMRANSIVIETPQSKVSLASSNPIELELKPGYLRLSFDHEVIVANGGELQGASLLLESLVAWRTTRVGVKDPLLHPRLSRLLAYLLKAENGVIALAILDVTGKGGALELRFHRRVKSAKLIDPVFNDAAELKVVDGLLRVSPAASYSILLVAL